MEIELIVQIGILGCLVYIIWFLRAFDVVNTRNWNSLYKYLEEIKKKLIQIKNGDHSLSRRSDLKKICKKLKDMISNN